jgi:hypothetical protein
MPVTLAKQGSTNRRLAVQVGPGIKQDPISKIASAKRTGRVAQVVAYLPSKRETLSSNPSTKQTNKKITHFKTPFGKI